MSATRNLSFAPGLAVERCSPESIHDLRVFSLWLQRLAGIFGALELTAAFLTGYAWLFTIAGIAIVLSGWAWGMRRAVDHDHHRLAAAGISYGLLFVALANTWAAPWAYPVLLLVCFMAVALGLPHFSARALTALLIAAFLACLAIGAIGLLNLGVAAVPLVVQISTLVGALTGVVFLVLFLLRQFSNRLRGALSAEREARHETEQARASLAVALQHEQTLVQQAQEGVRLRDEFVGIAAHELRTPLTSLQLELQSAQRATRTADVPPKVRQWLERALDSSERLHQLTHHLLDLSYINLQGLELRTHPTDLGMLVRDVVDRNANLLRQSACIVRLTLAGGVVGDWDAARLEQLVQNLLSNAIKFCAQKPVDIHLVSFNGRAELSVCDQGIGIDVAAQDRIFKRFERAVSSRHYGGFGLGLYICQQIVAAHGGKLTLDSTLGQGSCFTATLPLAPRNAITAPTGDTWVQAQGALKGCHD